VKLLSILRDRRESLPVHETTGKANVLPKVKQKKPIYGHWDKMMKTIQFWVQITSSNKEK